jgi:tetratricopeptide (TPR) repeat protein
MLKWVLWSLCLVSALHAIEVDYDSIKLAATTNADDINSRVLLLKHHMQNHEYTEAKAYIGEILALDPNHALAQRMQSRIVFRQGLSRASGLKEGSMSDALHRLYQKKKYKVFVDAYEKMHTLQYRADSRLDLEAARSYYRLKAYQKSQALLDAHPQQKNKAVIKLKNLVRLKQVKVSALDESSLSSLKDYVYLLNQSKKPNQAIATLSIFVQKNPSNKEARTMLSEQLYWQGDVKAAYHTLYPIRKSSTKRETLYANILYDKGDYEHAINFLQKVLPLNKDALQRYNLRKRIAYSYMHIGEKHKAQKIFEALLKQNPKDEEIINYLLGEEKENLYVTIKQARQAKAYEEELAAYLAYYERHPEASIAKEIAELYYFHQKQKASLPFYETYLAQQPEDVIVRFHYASALEKMKTYEKSIQEFQKIITKGDSEVYNLARYHYANSLMKTFKDEDWLRARETLNNLAQDLESHHDSDEKGLLKFTKTLQKIALGAIKKPTQFKDIYLTEGAQKKLKFSDVFSKDEVLFYQKPMVRMKSANKRALWAGLDYADDKVVKLYNAKLGINNLISGYGIHYGMHVEKFKFNNTKSHRKDTGAGIFIDARKGDLTLGIGLEKFDDIKSYLVPQIQWRPIMGIHTLYFDLYSRNGAFVSLRNCMVKTEDDVYHLGISDRILLENFDIVELGLDVNYFKDKNVNYFGQFSFPLVSKTLMGLEHRVFLHSDMEYNTKQTSCAHPIKFYDANYLKYAPKIRFSKGELELVGAVGYSFEQEEILYTYGVSLNYTIGDLVTVDASCERLQSSYTKDAMHFCRFNLIQAW